MGFFDNMDNWQEREEYATGIRAEAGPGYNVGIDDPIVKAVVTAGESGAVVNMVRELPDGKYMISMDIGGTAVANKDIITFSDGSATCGDYTLTYSDYALTITTVDEDTVVHIIMWKVAVNITNEFRAAIKDVVGDIGGGSSGGGALIVNLDSSTGALDKTVEEINNALLAGPVIISDNIASVLPSTSVETYHVLRVDMNKILGIKVAALKLSTGQQIGTYTPAVVTFTAAESTDYPELDT